MSNKPLSISRLASGGLITNYYCSSACRHCLYRCSPNWKKEFISVETARENLETIRKMGCTAVHIGGGEPLLKPDGVASVLKVAYETGVHVEYVETNSSWYRNSDAACSLLERLSDKGLSALLISISPFHNEFIPFYKVKGVTEACRRTGIAVFPWISEFMPDIKVFDESKTHALEEYMQYFGEGYLINLPYRYWLSPGGRALETFGKYPAKRSVPELAAEGRGGCSELEEIGHFHFDLYGNYIPGLCAGLSIQRDDLGLPLQEERYPILSRLFSRGIGGLVSYAEEVYGFSFAKPAYASKCELCYEIRRFLVMEKRISSRELQPEGHYS